MLTAAVAAQLQHGKQAQAVSRSIQLLQSCSQEASLVQACAQSGWLLLTLLLCLDSSIQLLQRCRWRSLSCKPVPSQIGLHSASVSIQLLQNCSQENPLMQALPSQVGCFLRVPYLS